MGEEGQANVVVNVQNEAGNADTQTESGGEGMGSDGYAVINSTTDGQGSWPKGGLRKQWKIHNDGAMKTEGDATRHRSD